MSKSIRRIKDPSTYIKDLRGYLHKQYIDAITVEHRSNNPKRDYLFVNKLQCKHIPSSPTKMIEMCDDLANDLILDGNILVIGFAETATAIGSILAERIENIYNNVYVTHTTREEVENCLELLKFEEEHSHATTQKLLVRKRFNIDNFDTILFVEDEISTGNTILNFVNKFREQYGIEMDFYVASICNWQSPDNQRRFLDADIYSNALIYGHMKNVNAKMFTPDTVELLDSSRKSVNWHKSKIYDFSEENKDKNNDSVFTNERLGHNKITEVPNLDKILELCNNTKAETIRVIGTEEFMTIPIKVGAELEKQGKTVLCHSTTRSKIDVIKDSLFDGQGSGIKSRHKVESFYEDERNTYIYNLEEKVDLTLVLSDTPNKEQFDKAIDSLSKAIGYNTDKIIGIRL